jgi:hypothetical protein
MPRHLTKELASIIAYNYQKNGFKDKGKALRDSGYSDSYSKQAGLKLYDNILVTDAIDRLQVINQVNCSLTAQEVMDDLEFGLAHAMNKVDLPMIAKFSELRGKTLAMFKDKIIQEEAIDSPCPEEADRISAERRQNIKIRQAKETKTA